MDLGALLVVLMLLALAGGYVALPFLDEREVMGKVLRSELEQRRSSLLSERERILSALQELELDEKLGKLPEGEYVQQRARWLLAGEEVLQSLKELNASVVKHVSVPTDRAVLPSRVGGELDEFEQLIAARRQVRSEKSGGFCPACGKAAQKSDRFCANCGASLKTMQ
jgi:NADH pyrophosphatase NudC (nudix superfamily)